jgi:plastocyanin
MQALEVQSKTGVRARQLLVAAMAATFLLVTAAQAAELEVKIDNFTFGPELLTVKAGTTVTWINEDDIPHVIAATDRSFKSKALDTDDRFSFTFTTPGTYAYFCSLHPHMTGKIVVEAKTGAAQR